jgi:hypothetical protein
MADAVMSRLNALCAIAGATALAVIACAAEAAPAPGPLPTLKTEAQASSLVEQARRTRDCRLNDRCGPPKPKRPPRR